MNSASDTRPNTRVWSSSPSWAGSGEEMGRWGPLGILRTLLWTLWCNVGLWAFSGDCILWDYFSPSGSWLSLQVYFHTSEPTSLSRIQNQSYRGLKKNQYWIKCITTPRKVYGEFHNFFFSRHVVFFGPCACVCVCVCVWSMVLIEERAHISLQLTEFSVVINWTQPSNKYTVQDTKCFWHIRGPSYIF